jgi:hypothetical protein
LVVCGWVTVAAAPLDPAELAAAIREHLGELGTDDMFEYWAASWWLSDEPRKFVIRGWVYELTQDPIPDSGMILLTLRIDRGETRAEAALAAYPSSIFAKIRSGLETFEVWPSSHTWIVDEDTNEIISLAAR